jgi:cytochrome d ubiquinol oxidase subunit II
MTVTAVLLMPVVLLYQGWSFHVFRARVGAPQATAPPEQK